MPAVALAGTLGGQTAQDALESKPLMGMGVEEVVADGGSFRIQTLGAVVISARTASFAFASGLEPSGT